MLSERRCGGWLGMGAGENVGGRDEMDGGGGEIVWGLFFSGNFVDDFAPP